MMTTVVRAAAERPHPAKAGVRSDGICRQPFNKGQEYPLAERFCAANGRNQLGTWRIYWC